MDPGTPLGGLGLLESDSQLQGLAVNLGLAGQHPQADLLGLAEPLGNAQGAEADEDELPLPTISGPEQFARSVDPAWRSMAAEAAAEDLAAWAAEAGAGLPDLPAAAVLAAVVALQEGGPGSAGQTLVNALTKALAKGAALLEQQQQQRGQQGNSKQRQRGADRSVALPEEEAQGGQPSEKEAARGLLVLSFLASQVLLCEPSASGNTAGPGSAANPSSVGTKRQRSDKAAGPRAASLSDQHLFRLHSAAMKVALACCVAVHGRMGTGSPTAMLLHAEVAQAMHGACVHGAMRLAASRAADSRQAILQIASLACLLASFQPHDTNHGVPTGEARLAQASEVPGLDAAAAADDDIAASNACWAFFLGLCQDLAAAAATCRGGGEGAAAGPAGGAGIGFGTSAATSAAAAAAVASSLITETLVGVAYGDQVLRLALALAHTLGSSSRSSSSTRGSSMQAHAEQQEPGKKGGAAKQRGTRGGAAGPGKAAQVLAAQGQGALAAAEEAVILNGLVTALTRLGDPLACGLALHELQQLMEAPGAKASTKRALLDVATCAVCEERTVSRMALRVMQLGALDRDASIRARALGCLTATFGPLMEQEVEEAAAASASADPPAAGTSLGERVASLLLETTVPVAAGRLLDSAKSVRSGALALLIEVLAWEIPNPGQQQQQQTTQAAAIRRQAAAAVQQAAARACFQGVCCLLDATPASPLYDDACTEAAERLLQLVGSTLGEEALLRLLLGQTLRRPGVFTDPSGPEVVAAAAAAESGSAAGGANVGMGLSVGVVSTLLARFSPQSYPRVYTPWAEAVGSMETLEEMEAAQLLLFHDGCAGMVQAVRQEAVRRLCQAMAMAAGEQEEEEARAAALAADAGVLPALKLLVCFTQLGYQGNASLNKASIGACTKEQRQQQQQGKGEQQEQDLLGEVSILIDLLTQLLPSGAADAPQEGVHGHGQRQRGKEQHQQQQTNCALWGFRALHHHLSIMASYPLTHNSAAQQQQAPGAGTGGSSARAAAAALALRFFRRCLPQLLLHSQPLPVLDAAMAGLCACPGAASMAHKLLGHLERLMECSPPSSCSGAAEQGPLPTGQEGPAMQPQKLHARAGQCKHSRALAAYLCLLRHMCSLYEAEHREFLEQVRSSRQGGGPGGAGAPQDPAAADPGQEASVNARSKATAETFDYMQGEESSRGMHALGQQYLGGLMQQTAPASKIPLLLALLSPSHDGEDQGTEAVPEEMKVLALQALGRKMCLLDDLAKQHQPVLAACLLSCLPPSAHTAQGTAHSSKPAASATNQHAGAASVADHRLAVAALQIAEQLIVRSPNINSSLLQPMEALISHLLTSTTTPSQGIGGPKASRMHGSKAHAALDGSRALASAFTAAAPSRPAADGSAGGITAVQPPSQPCPLLITALAAYAHALASQKLQISGTTWALLARLALSIHPEVQGITLQAVRALLCAADGQAAGAGKRGASASAAAAGAGPSRGGHAVKGALALYSNCPANLRLRLVEEVLLATDLLLPADLASDALALPVLQSLFVALDHTAARSAAVAFLRALTPSSKVLAAVAGSVQSSHLEQLPAATAREVLAGLKAFVQQHRRGAGAGAAAGSGAEGSPIDPVQAQGPGMGSGAVAGAPGGAAAAAATSSRGGGDGAADASSAPLAAAPGTTPGAAGHAGEGAGGTSAAGSKGLQAKLLAQLDLMAASIKQSSARPQAAARHAAAPLASGPVSSQRQGPGAGAGTGRAKSVQKGSHARGPPGQRSSKRGLSSSGSSSSSGSEGLLGSSSSGDESGPAGSYAGCRRVGEEGSGAAEAGTVQDALMQGVNLPQVEQYQQALQRFKAAQHTTTSHSRAPQMPTASGQGSGLHALLTPGPVQTPVAAKATGASRGAGPVASAVPPPSSGKASVQAGMKVFASSRGKRRAGK